MNGDYSVVFMSPESLVLWETELENEDFKDRIALVCLDEVHTVVQW